MPHNTFLDIEAGRETTVRLYLGVLPLLELQLKAEGSTLAQTVKTLDSRAKSLRYYASTVWHYTPPKIRADTYLAIFRLCENTVRERLGYKRKVGGLFGGSPAELEPVFEEVLGQRVRALLPPEPGFIRPAFAKDNHLTLYTFAGTHLNHSLAFGLRRLSIDFLADEPSSSFSLHLPLAQLPALCAQLRQVLSEVDFHLEAALVENPALFDFAKWGQPLPMALQVAILKERYFDFERLREFLGEAMVA